MKITYRQFIENLKKVDNVKIGIKDQLNGEIVENMSTERWEQNLNSLNILDSEMNNCAIPLIFE